MTNYNKTSKKQKIIKMLYVLGFLMIIITYLLFARDVINVLISYLFFSFGIVLMIPDYYYFHKERRIERLSDYWLVQFLTLPFILIIFIICIIRYLT